MIRLPIGELTLAAFLCLLLSLLLGVRAIFLIKASKGRLRGYALAIMSVGISTALLLALPVLMLVLRGPEGNGGRSGRSPATESDRSPGRGKTAAAHGPNCQKIRAAKSLRADMYRAEALEPIAERGDLTTHEQMHLVDVVIEDIGADMYRKEVLIRLARNTALTAEGRAYLIENLNGMSTDMWRSDVIEAVQQSSQPNSK